jgi:hypothetical protein
MLVTNKYKNSKKHDDKRDARRRIRHSDLESRTPKHSKKKPTERRSTD